MLEAENISASYDGQEIIRNISISLKRGEIVGLLGVSGAGKTTLFNVLSGLKVPDKGRVVLNGTDITGKPGKVSYMLQKDLLLPFKTILDNVALPLLIRGEKKSVAREKTLNLFVDFGLEGTQNKYPNEISGGMRQRCALLRTYLYSDGVALLDEPFSALDAITKQSIHGWYLDMMVKIDLATIFITHDIDEAIALSDRVYIMTGKPGKIIDEIFLPSQREKGKEYTLTNEFLMYKKKALNLI